MIERLPELVNGDAALVRRGRFFSDDILIEVGAVPWHVSIRAGHIDDVTRGPVLMRPWTFAVRAPEDAWRAFWQPLPAPGYHDIFAMTKSGLARIDGALQPLMANLRYVKDVLAAPRRLPDGG